MMTLILTIHLLCALTYVGSVSILGLSALFRRPAATAQKVAYSGFGMVAVSGIVLTFLSPTAISQFCISMLVATVCGVVVAGLYRQRVVAFNAR